mgnify:CR=1 FL=1
MFQSFEAKHPKFYQVFRFFIITFASILYAWNLRCFAKTAGLFPGGFSGLSLLLQEIIIKFLHITIPFSIFNIALNLFPTYIAFKYIGNLILMASAFHSAVQPFSLFCFLLRLENRHVICFFIYHNVLDNTVSHKQRIQNNLIALSKALS